VGGVPLFARRLAIRLQDPVDEGGDRLQAWAGAHRGALLPGHRALHRFSHQPAMHAELPGHALDRAEAELVLPSDLFE
jgi:hypothetical protein